MIYMYIYIYIGQAGLFSEHRKDADMFITEHHLVLTSRVFRSFCWELLLRRRCVHPFSGIH